MSSKRVTLYTSDSTSERPRSLPPRGVREVEVWAGDDLVAGKCVVAGSLFSRIRGLIGRKWLAPSEGLLIKRCAAIHTFFMSIPIDVVFVDKSLQVAGALEDVAPWRSPRRFPGARHAIELPSGAVAAKGIHPGLPITLRWSDG